MNNFKSVLFLTASAVAAVGAAGVASADDSALPAPKMTVHFKTEDLNSEAGVHRVYLQIRLAAENVCPAISTGTLLTSERTLSCRKAAIAAAIDAIHNKRLAEVASASKSG